MWARLNRLLFAPVVTVALFAAAVGGLQSSSSTPRRGSAGTVAGALKLVGQAFHRVRAWWWGVFYLQVSGQNVHISGSLAHI